MIRRLLGTALVALVIVFPLAATAQSLSIEIPEAGLNETLEKGDNETGLPTKLKLTDRMAEQIRTLIRIAIQTGDASAFETALFDLVSETPELAVAVAVFTTSEVSIQTASKSANTALETKPVTPGLVKSLTVAATVGPATASPEKFQEIVAATTKTISEFAAASPVLNGTGGEVVDSAALLKEIETEVVSSLIELFPGEDITAEELAGLLTASGPEGLAEFSTKESASPAG